MRALRVLALPFLLASCASLGIGGGGGDRKRDWDGAYRAYVADSLRLSEERFARLEREHPGTLEGREAKFFLAVLALDPRHAGWSARDAQRHLTSYLALDTARAGTIFRHAEATALLRLSSQLVVPCEERIGPLRCETRVVERRVPGAPQPTQGVSGAEVDRLRREIAERDDQIRQLREELTRIRNTLVPRRP